MVQNVVLFQGTNTSSKRGLWETNGTTTGTFELTPIVGANASGLSPSNITGYNGEVLFEGLDLSTPSGHYGLWVTTGTAAGTKEIAGTSGLSPNDLTVFGGQVLFSGGSGLWATNGTAAGTHEVTSVAGAPGDLTVFGSEVLFAGATGGLWETDGSSGGTHELAGTAGLNPFDLTVFGSEVLFASSTGGLWETNGAVGSTPTEIARRHAAGHGCLQWRGAIQRLRWRRGRPVGDERRCRQHPDGDQRHFGAQSSRDDRLQRRGAVQWRGQQRQRTRVMGVEWNQRNRTRLGDRPLQFRNQQRSCAVQRLGFKWPCSVVGDQRPGRRHE